MSECTPVAIYNHILFEVVDNNGNIIKDNDPTYLYWSGKDGNIKCPKYEHESYSTATIYWICAGILIPLRLFISYMQLRIAAHIIQKRRGDKNNNQSNQMKSKSRRKFCFGVPFTTAFELFHTIVVVTAALAYGLHEAMSPIEAHILLSLCASTFIISHILSTMKLIHLGQRLLPISLRGDKIVMNNKIQGDKILLFLFSSMVLCEILAPIFSLIIATVTRDTKMSIYSLVFHGIAVQMGIFILVRQGTRLISYMIESNSSKPPNKIETNTTIENNPSNPSNAIPKVEEVDQITRLIHRMRIRITAAFFCGTPPALILILGGLGVFPMYWYFLYILAYGISLASLASTVVFLPRGMSLFCCWCRRNSDRNQDQSSEKNDTTKNKTLSNSRQSKLVPGVVSVPNTLAGDQVNNDSYHHHQNQSANTSQIGNTQTE